MADAVIAHYSHSSEWEPNFLLLVRLTSQVFNSVIVVSTKKDIQDLPLDLSNVTIRRRPNIGYDFYSYRVGIDIALENSCCDGILLINSSIYVVDPDSFLKTLKIMINKEHKHSVRAITRSGQIADHIQSYMIYFDFRLVSKEYIIQFFQSVEPVNTKFETIATYELGLSRFLRLNRITYCALYKPTLVERLTAIFWSSRFFYLILWIKGNGKLSLIAPFTEINWSHFAAAELARHFGFVKAEFLRSNPYFLPQHPVLNKCSSSTRSDILNAVADSRGSYYKAASGLNELKPNKHFSEIILELVDTPKMMASTSSIAVVVHLFYIDILDEIISYIKNIVEPFDLYITTPFPADIAVILNHAGLADIPICIGYANNRGRDIGPFIALYRTGRLDRYYAVLKLHSKKSIYSQKGSHWRNELLTSLCGSSLVSLTSIDLLRNKGCGIIGPSQYFLTNPQYWGANQSTLACILSHCGIDIDENSLNLAFFAGSMFWFKPEALGPIHTCSLGSLDFEEENGLQDGTLAHAWERAFCLIANSCDFKISSVCLGGEDILGIESNRLNSVPVL